MLLSSFRVETGRIASAGNAVAAPSGLIPTHDPEEFTAAPIGRCFVGPTFVIWCYAPDLQGSVIWGVLDERAIREMMTIGGFIRHPAIARRRRAISDVRDVESADADVLLGFTAMARKHAGWADAIERQAVIVPAGIGGMLLAGALPLVGVEHPLRIVQDLDAALAFVDHPAARIATTTAANIAAAIRGPSALLSRLRTQLGRDPSSVTLKASSAALGMSTRTLQRELRRLDTSFSRELRRVRVGAAKALLVHSDLKIDAIATRVGLNTASRMSSLLRREYDLTASQLRAQRRASDRHAVQTDREQP